MIASPRFSLLLALNIWDLGLKWWQESMLASHLFPIGSKLMDAFLSLFLLRGVCVKGILCLLIFILSWGKPSEGPWSRWGDKHRSIFPQLCPRGDRVGLLQFADDMILFFNAKDKWASIINETLKLYALESGQKINRSKSDLIFLA